MTNAITKVLVANRGEIAIRACRAAFELGIETVAVYADEDRNSLHRQKADEAYRIGEPGHPVRAYLDVEQITEVARASSCDAIYPGYGFLSESPELARACERDGLVFVGPAATTLAVAGNKLAALDAARSAGLPTLRTSPQVQSADEAGMLATEVGFPLYVKAAAGGGGRGLRRVDSPEDLAAAVESAMREAAGAFGDSTVFLEQAVLQPRHIEVQVLGDSLGEVVHLFERDCSLQRRHQKVIEIAPAPNLDPALQRQICDDAVRFAREIGYRNAGTVEFLLGADGSHVFIEMNPRIQVEHTVTEEVTDVDLVQAQLRLASGETISDLGLSQETIRCRGAALQCRITTEDPAAGFRPDTGTITAYRAPGGAGIRLDAGSVYAGAEISPYFDSLLVKLTCRGQDLAAAAARADRALAEFRIRGVNTNLAFLRTLASRPELLAGEFTTAFLDEHPDLRDAPTGADRTSKLLNYLADVTVNRPHGLAPTRMPATDKLPPGRVQPVVRDGSRELLQRVGPAEWAAQLRGQREVAVTDTTCRDAHQSLIATRMRTIDMIPAVSAVAERLPGLLSLEVWGGATYDVALRFLSESPWKRLERLREAAPGICLQMLLRGRNTVGYTPYPDEVCQAFVAEAHATGIDVFRIFDALNNVDSMRPAIDAVLECGSAIAEGTMCYTGNLADPAEPFYRLDYYLHLADQLNQAGVHVLCIKDMAGLLTAPAAHTLVTALRDRFEQPVHLHTHDTAGGQVATYLAAVQAGVDAIDGAFGPFAGTTSQPSLGAIVAALEHSDRPTNLSVDDLAALEPYWAAVRSYYRPFEGGTTTPTTSVYRHEIPGGQISNLRAQAVAVGLGERFEQIEEAYAAANELLGDIIKVTPTSKVVGDLALVLASSSVSAEQFAANPAIVDLPESVKAFLAGELGEPPTGWPEPLRSSILAAQPQTIAAERLSDEDLARLSEPGEGRRDRLDELLFPQPAASFGEARRRYGDLSVVPTPGFFYGLDHEELPVQLEPGVTVNLALQAVGEPDDRGIRQVFCRVNGQVRVVEAVDRSATAHTPTRRKADPNEPMQVAAPYTGLLTPTVQVGDRVEAGDVIAVIEAMKMESSLTSSVAGLVRELVVKGPTHVDGGDLIVVLQDR